MWLLLEREECLSSLVTSSVFLQINTSKPWLTGSNSMDIFQQHSNSEESKTFDSVWERVTK